MNKKKPIHPIHDSVTSEIAIFHHSTKNPGSLKYAPPSHLTKYIIFGICAWSLVEAPLEVGVSSENVLLIAIVISKVIVVGMGFATISNVRFAHAIFFFICGASVFAIAPALPIEYEYLGSIAMFSIVECLLKTACVIMFFIDSAHTSLQKALSNWRA